MALQSAAAARRLEQLSVRFRYLQRQRNASSRAPSQQPIVLEKPDRFRPPSHPARLVKKSAPRHYPGPPLSDADLAAQKTKRYPNMMPPEGTRLHWFLTNRTVHVALSLSFLFSLAGYVFFADFHKHNKYPHLLPPSSLFWSGHPFQFLSQYAQVYKMHVEANSADVAERRRKNIEDANKRKQYLKEHGLWKDRWWLGEEPTPEEKAEAQRREVAAVAAAEGAAAAVREGEVAAAEVGGEFRNLEGNVQQQRKVKKWFGIW